MGKYVDAFVVPVPKSNIDEYRKFCELTGQVWREHGALEYVEFVADDVKAGDVTSFPQSVKLEDDETVVVAYILYESRQHRDEVLEKAMNDPRMPKDPKDLPCDAKRLFWGGFEELYRN